MKNLEKINNKKSNAVFYGVLAGVGLLFVYLIVISLLNSFNFALLNLRSFWYLIFPLAVGFGTQIGLLASIKHSAQAGVAVGSTSAVSGGSMLACCSHFALNLIPLAGASGASAFLMKYQPWFLGFGLLSSAVGIGIILNHKIRMKGGRC